MCVCALWLQENKQCMVTLRLKNPIHSTQHNTSQSPPQLTTSSLSVYTIHINTPTIQFRNTKQTNATLSCIVQRRDDNNQSIQQQDYTTRPPDNYYKHNTRPTVSETESVQRRDRTSHNKPTTTTNQINHRRTTTSSFLAQGTNTIRA